MKYLTALLFLALALSAQAKQPITTGRTISAWILIGEFPKVRCGSNYYAEVDSAWLNKDMYGAFLHDLCRHGLENWDERFDCNQFAAYFCALAQIKHAQNQWHSWGKNQALALAPFWYKRTNGQRHAVVVAKTERGTIYFEPQDGKEVTLTAKEIASAEPPVF